MDDNKVKTQELVKKMFKKQDELNIYTNGVDWKRNLKLKWYRAIWVECAELIDYTDWKWWKKETVKLRDIEMEVIDIWHFLMSELMTRSSIELCTRDTLYSFENNFKTYQNFRMERIREHTEKLVKNIFGSPYCALDDFVRLCGTIGPHMDITGIYKLYIGKNVLNKFRQDNGYKQKTYQKIWDNEKEDNCYLMLFLNEIKEVDDNFEQLIYYKLQRKYEEIIK